MNHNLVLLLNSYRQAIYSGLSPHFLCHKTMWCMCVCVHTLLAAVITCWQFPSIHLYCWLYIFKITCWSHEPYMYASQPHTHTHTGDKQLEEGNIFAHTLGRSSLQRPLETLGNAYHNTEYVITTSSAAGLREAKLRWCSKLNEGYSTTPYDCLASINNYTT